MADKKEVLEYLRNQQKAAEIEAKMNGVNIWVLLGAIAVVGWQLTGGSVGRIWDNWELVLRTLVAVVAMHMLTWIVRRSGHHGDDIRFSTSSTVDIESPYLVLLKGALLLAPPLGLGIVAGKSVGLFPVGLLGFVFVTVSILAIASALLSNKSTKERFPKPEFGLSRRANAIFELLFGLLLLISIGEQVAFAMTLKAGLSMEEVRQLVLVGVLYLLVLIVVERRLQNDSIAWTYEMETDLVIERVSPDVAIRRIENRRLGPRLQDVVDRFFDELDERFGALNSMLEECAKKIESARKVPAEYPAERTARLQEASAQVTEHISSIGSDLKEFREYLTKLEPKLRGNSRLVFASLAAKHEMYERRTRQAKTELERMAK